MIKREVVILSAVRTALGKFGGALKDIPPTELAGDVVRESMKRSGLASSEIGNLAFGHVIHTDAKDVSREGCSDCAEGCPSKLLLSLWQTGYSCSDLPGHNYRRQRFARGAAMMPLAWAVVLSP